ncbi:alanine racemase [Enterococcus asini]|uniref:alanine racemase n=1 Tax=Enterococcus asini TaxID=57732 RepID=UPI00288F8216|nr:alanine racemase [Enterococcus asini]MDT2757396.1 alanine racemase [Enterococcus asini]
MVESIHRPTKLIIHNQAIVENVANEVKRLPQGRELFAVVKANGYGHGAVATAQAAKAGGATGFCVATIDEGIELREAGFTEPILILGVVPVVYLPIVAEYQLAFPVNSLAWLTQAQNYLAKTTLSAPLLAHLKVDTGMGRIGFQTKAEVLEALALIEGLPALVFDGIFTHFATADEAEDGYYQEQHDRFKEILESLPQKPRYVHVSNSATALWHEEELGNMVRFGVAMYGLNPSGHALKESYPLQPALEFVSQLVQVKQVPAGAKIGYGATYTSPESEWIGTVPVGYADGWLRKMSGFSVLVEGVHCEIIGRVCMDQFMIRLPHALPEGTKVTLVGKNGDQEITLQEVADHLDTIHYEVACLLSERIPREYQG